MPVLQLRVWNQKKWTGNLNSEIYKLKSQAECLYISFYLNQQQSRNNDT